MTTHLTTIMTVAVHHPDQNPYHGEGVTHLSLETEGAGFFFVLRQPVPFENRPNGEIAIDPEELQALAAAGRLLLDQPGIQEHDKS